MSDLFAKPRRGIKRSHGSLNVATRNAFDFSPKLGRYGFTLNHSISTKDLTYLPDNNVLYIKYDTPVPIRFRMTCDPSQLPAGAFIRAMIVYKYKDSDAGVRELPRVTRCYNHRQGNEGVEGLHVITSTPPGSTLTDNVGEGGFCVEVPLSSMRRTEEGFTRLYRFSCYSSCFEDPILAVFDLVARGEVLGRAVVDARVCACPIRDKKVAVGRMRQSSPTGGAKRKKRRVEYPSKDLDLADAYFHDNTLGTCTLLFSWELKDPAMYNFLVQLKHGYQLDRERFMRTLPAYPPPGDHSS